DGSQPIGRRIGPVLEARDVRQVLENRSGAPADLKEKAIALAGMILEFDPELPGGRGAARARELLESGAAVKKMDQIIEAQGQSPCSPGPGPLTYDVVSGSDGWIEAIDCARIGR